MKTLDVILIGALALAGCSQTKPVECDEEVHSALVGGGVDAHSCIPTAGYQWCPSTGKCQRMWEEYCEEFKAVYRGKSKMFSGNEYE